MNIRNWLIGGTVVTSLLVGAGLKKISDVVEKEELAKPKEQQAEIVKENITVSQTLINKKAITNWLYKVDIFSLPKNNNLFICSGYGCLHKSKTKFTEQMYNDVKVIMDTSTDSESERTNLKAAIDSIKLSTGIVTGTSQDTPGEPFMGNGKKEQMSGLDETINTMQYLYLLAEGGYIKYHHLESPSTAKYFIGTVNVIVDKDSKKSYAVAYDKTGKATIVERN